MSSSRTLFPHSCKGRRKPIFAFILRPTHLSLLLFLKVRIRPLPRLPTQNTGIMMQRTQAWCIPSSQRRTYRTLAAIVLSIDLSHGTEKRRRRRCAWVQGWARTRCRQWRGIRCREVVGGQVVRGRLQSRCYRLFELADKCQAFARRWRATSSS